MPQSSLFPFLVSYLVSCDKSDLRCFVALEGFAKRYVPTCRSNKDGGDGSDDEDDDENDDDDEATERPWLWWWRVASIGNGSGSGCSLLDTTISKHWG